MPTACHAIAATATHQVPLTAHHVPRSEVVHIAADLDDLADEFMTHD